MRRLVPIVILVVSSLSSKELSSDSLRQLSFEELMDVKVSVTSRYNEPIYDAAGIVTAYDRSDIETYGYNTIRDFADITPGYSGTHLYGEHGLETRGLASSSFNNNRHLVLFDGIPINHARANKAPVDEELSLFSADRIEFLRGPASALYGTGAYYGVVNIVPRVLSENGTEYRSRAGAGGDIPERHLDAFTTHRGENNLFYSGISYYQREASKKQVGTDPDTHYRNWNDSKAVTFAGAYSLLDGPLKGFGVGSLYLSRRSGLGEHWNGDFSHEINDLHWETFITYLKLQREFSDLLNINSYLKYNRSTETGTFTPLSHDQYTPYSGTGDLLYTYSAPINDYQYFLQLDFRLPVLTLSGGGEFDLRYQPGVESGTNFYYITGDAGPTAYVKEEVPSQRSENYKTASLFLQSVGEVPLLEGMKITGGVRADFGKSPLNSFYTISPRLSVVQRFTDFLNAKLLYGTALLAPGIKELELNREAMNSSPGLSLDDVGAETFSTLEAGLLYHGTAHGKRTQIHITSELNGFYNQSLNELKDGQVEYNSKVENYFYNSNDTVTSTGVEFAVKAVADFGVGVFANYSYAEAHASENGALRDVPFHKINGGVSYQSEELGFYSALIGRYVHEYTIFSGNNSSGYAVADWNGGWVSPLGIGIELAVTNLLDESFLYPVSHVSLIPMPSRHLSASLTATF